MHLVCQVSAPIVANIATFELPGRLSYFYLASLLGWWQLEKVGWVEAVAKPNGSEETVGFHFVQPNL
jgi:hypothetical protein